MARVCRTHHLLYFFPRDPLEVQGTVPGYLHPGDDFAFFIFEFGLVHLTFHDVDLLTFLDDHDKVIGVCQACIVPDTELHLIYADRLENVGGFHPV